MLAGFCYNFNVGKVVILFNPSSGRGRSARKQKQIERVFASFGIGYDLKVSSSERNLKELAAQAVREYETIVAVGGDTTFNIVAAKILNSRSPVRPALGMIGTGSANDVCRGLGISRIETLCRAVVNRRVKKMDVGLAEPEGHPPGLYFLGSMSLGLGTAVNRYLAEFSRRHPYLSRCDVLGQGLAGSRGVFRAFSRKQVPVSVSLEDETGKKDVTFSLLVLLNTGYYANGLNLSPGASPFDGLLDAVIIFTESTFQTVRFQRAVRRSTHLSRKEFHRLRLKRFVLESETGTDFQLDGEIYRKVRRCRVSVLAGALDVFIPVEYNENGSGGH